MKNLKIAVRVALCIVLFNFLITSFTGWVKNPEMSQMEIFMRSPQYFLWDFDE